MKLTRHAQRRRKEMGVTEDEIERVLSDATITYPGVAGRRCIVGGRLVVVTDPSQEFVVTVLWAGRDSRDEGEQT